MQVKKYGYVFPSLTEVFIYSFLLIAVLWSVYLVQSVTPGNLVKYGIHPKDWTHWYGVLCSPLLHSPDDFKHLINNSIPAAVLFAFINYFYREIAFRVLLISWIFSGLFVWIFAENRYSYHIGFSSVIYAFAGFLILSGVLRKFKPLQIISLLVVFLYGSLIWGIFPIEISVSWEGHLSGLVTGLLLAYMYRKKGIQEPKYQYEIEKELGIEPPDLEGIYNEKLRQLEEETNAYNQEPNSVSILTGEAPRIVYEYKTKTDERKE